MYTASGYLPMPFFFQDWSLIYHSNLVTHPRYVNAMSTIFNNITGLNICLIHTTHLCAFIFFSKCVKKMKVSCVCMCVDCTLHAVIIADGSQSQAGGKVLAADTADVLYALRGLTHLWVRDKNSRSVPNFVLSFNYGQILKLSANDDIIQAYCENKVNNGCFAWQLKSTITTVLLQSATL